MTLGEKVKHARKSLKLTQSELAGDKITRNMLSAIESDKANPSIDTIKYIADTLKLPLPYFFSNDNDLFYYEKLERLPAIKSALENKNYNVCISLILNTSEIDDELAYILASCYFELGMSCINNGSLQSAEKYLELCDKYCDSTIYDTGRFETVLPLYLSVAKNASSPLLEFDSDRFHKAISGTLDYEFYKYLTLDFSYNFTNERYRLHMEAKKLIKERKYSEALGLLTMLEETKSKYEPNAYLMFCIYADMENCYKQLFNFESAYKYSSKRISLMEGFKS